MCQIYHRPLSLVCASLVLMSYRFERACVLIFLYIQIFFVCIVLKNIAKVINNPFQPFFSSASADHIRRGLSEAGGVKIYLLG